jgi:hypothetical protein
MKRNAWIVSAVMMVAGTAYAGPPAITKEPVLDTVQVLSWPRDVQPTGPDLTNPTSNMLEDLHGTLGHCDLMFSSEGNYNMALKELWAKYIAAYPDDGANRMYTTSPPVSPGQVTQGSLQIGNYRMLCRPQVAVGNKSVMDKLRAANAFDGEPTPLYAVQGSVILVKKGNPKHIQTVWDLGRQGIRLVTPNPKLEPGAFNRYAGTIYNVAANDPHPPQGMSADKLYNTLFNGQSGDPMKWLCGVRIHHRDEPWSLAYGHADAALIMYHLAKYTVDSFPDKFEMIPIGGSVDAPKPLPGNATGETFVVKIRGDWTDKQKQAADHLYASLLSDDFTRILEKNGLMRATK